MIAGAGADTINDIPSRQGRLRELLLVACFCFFLVPISIDGNSANYSFMLVPIAVALATGRIRMPSTTLLLFILFYVFIFALATVYQYALISELERRAMSFILFMSMFSFMFVKIDERMVRAFKSAVILAGVFFSLSSMVTFFALGGSALGFDAKDAVGGQRYGFIYLLAFWLLLHARPVSLLARLLKPVATFILLIGIVLTFSRASVIAMGASFAPYIVWTIRHEARLSFGRVLKRVVLVALGVAVAGALLAAFFPVIFDFFDVRLFEFLADRETVQGNLADADTSEGTRIFIWTHILEYVVNNPLTGSGYLGVWILRLFDEMSGSAHNQYFDVLFRVGILGFLIHLFLLYKTGRYLAQRHADLFWGFLGVVIYGVFHETFKESHGGFVLAFLFGMMSQPRTHAPIQTQEPHAYRPTQGLLRG